MQVENAELSGEQTVVPVMAQADTGTTSSLDLPPLLVEPPLEQQLARAKADSMLRASCNALLLTFVHCGEMPRAVHLFAAMRLCALHPFLALRPSPPSSPA
jgi:hypothetical protein